MTEPESFEPHRYLGDARDAAIEDAAQRLDLAAAPLGPGGRPQPSEAGDIARVFAQDAASLGRPILHRVDLDAIDPTAKGMPVTVAELTRTSRLYLVSFPVSLYTRRGRGFNRLQVKVEFNAGDDGRRPVTYDVLPDQQWATRFEVGADLAVGVRADLKLAVGLPAELAAPAGLPFSGGADTDGTAGAKLVLGPLKYALRVPEIEHTAPGHDHVFWALDGGDFAQEQDPGLRVVLSVPNEVSDLQITAYAQATRYYNLLQARLREAIKDLPAAVRSFFTDGTPFGAHDTWDLTKDL